MPKKTPVVLNIKRLASTRVFQVEELQVRFSDGHEQSFERVATHNSGAVMIIPLLDDETFLLIREYAPAADQYILGFPKGAMDDHENPLDAANRELMEETGYGAHTLQQIATWSLSPAYFPAVMNIILAKNLYPNKIEGDEPEPIEVIPWKINNIQALLSAPEFHESRSVAAVLLLERLFHARSSFFTK